jgi:hypothetical protein
MGWVPKAQHNARPLPDAALAHCRRSYSQSFLTKKITAMRQNRKEARITIRKA